MEDGHARLGWGSSRSRGTRLGWLPAFLVTAILASFIALYATGRRYRAQPILSAWGIDPFRFPFLDADTVMSALRCIRQGVDVFAANPCDVLGRVYDYSPLWLHLAVLPFDETWIAPVGLLVDGLFLAALACLPGGRRWWEIGAVVLAALSPPVVFALERANNDLIIFALASLTASLSVRTKGWRSVGYAAAFLAGLLKYYPMLLMAFAVRERLGRFLVITLVSVAALLLFVAVDREPLIRALALIPTGSFFGDMFGARTLSAGIAQWLDLPPWVAGIGQGAMDGVAIAVGLGMAFSGRIGRDLRRLPARSLAFLVAGAILTVACFSTAQNIGYRAIHLLLLVPALALLAGDAARRGPWRFHLAVVLLLLWAEGWRHWHDLAIGGNSWTDPLHPARLSAWLLREACWWWTIGLCWAVLFAVLRRAPAMLDLYALGRRAVPNRLTPRRLAARSPAAVPPPPPRAR